MAKKAKKTTSRARAAHRPGTPIRRQCGTMEVHHRLLERHPEFRQSLVQIEMFTARAFLFGAAARTQLATIPVIVHVVYNSQEQNISDAQINSQIKAMNRDYRASNTDKSNTPSVWKSLIADCNIEFTLEDVTRTQSAKTSFGTDDGVKSEATGGISPKEPDKYLNLWVCNLGGGLLGYAQFPGGPAATDGVVILHTAFGTTGTAAAPFNLGRTAVHEVGHYLNLHHIWGDSVDCSGSDYVADTPTAQLPNYGKPAFPHVSCNNGPNGDMFMNYMDYVNDDTMVMFTSGQAARMAAALSGPRSSLSAPATGVTH
jgi:hypothetical protein